MMLNITVEVKNILTTKKCCPLYTLQILLASDVVYCWKNN